MNGQMNDRILLSRFQNKKTENQRLHPSKFGHLKTYSRSIIQPGEIQAQHKPKGAGTNGK